MKVKDLNGNWSNLKLTGYITTNQGVSSIHLQARTLLNELYPTLQILEEVPIRTRFGETLFLDFFIPLLKINVEVHGRQHYEFVQHFHKTRIEFAQALARDSRKKQWCEINTIEQIELSYREKADEWRTKFTGGGETSGSGQNTQ